MHDQDLLKGGTVLSLLLKWVTFFLCYIFILTILSIGKEKRKFQEILINNVIATQGTNV